MVPGGDSSSYAAEVSRAGGRSSSFCHRRRGNPYRGSPLGGSTSAVEAPSAGSLTSAFTSSMGSATDLVPDDPSRPEPGRDSVKLGAHTA